MWVQLRKPVTNRIWARCPRCGSKVTVFDNTANCHGVYEKCTRNSNCRNVFELIIVDGVQYTHDNDGALGRRIAPREDG